MASILELTYPDNVRLCRGAMQNWRDLVTRGPAWAPGITAMVHTTGGSVAVVGAHPPAFIATLADRFDRVTVIVRAIPDAAEIGKAVPSATVLCGDLGDALNVLADDPAGPHHDVVVALDDVTRTASAEGPTRSWRDLTTFARRLAHSDGVVWLAIENDGGLHRNHVLPAPATRGWDADWTPLATWDATRPRSRTQVDAALDGPTCVWTFGPDWRLPTVLSSTPSSADSRSLSAALAGLPHGSSHGHVLGLRTAALADDLESRCAGWLVRMGGPIEAGTAPTCHTVTGHVAAHWTVADGRARADDGRTISIPARGRTFLRDLVEKSVDNDLAGIRRDLTAWRAHLDSRVRDGSVPATDADARFGNLAVHEDGSLTPLMPAGSAVAVNTVLWSALADFLNVLRSQGLHHPWPRIQDPDTVLESMGAIVGLDPASIPTGVRSRPAPAIVDDGRSRDELLSVVSRQDGELRALWSRLRWTEREYAAHRAIEAGKSRARNAQATVRRVVGRSANGVAARFRRS